MDESRVLSHRNIIKTGLVSVTGTISSKASILDSVSLAALGDQRQL